MDLKLVYYPDPILRREAEPVERIDEEILAIAEEMIRIMNLSHGIGLAAPQAGISKQIIVVNPTGDPGEESVYLNPRILKRKGREMGEEGCLSFPGIYGNVMRAHWIRLSAKLLTGEEVVFEVEDFTARIFQHEIDHLRGVLFPDKVQPAEQITMQSRLKEMETAYAPA